MKASLSKADPGIYNIALGYYFVKGLSVTFKVNELLEIQKKKMKN